MMMQLLEKVLYNVMMHLYAKVAIVSSAMFLISLSTSQVYADMSWHVKNAICNLPCHGTKKILKFPRVGMLNSKVILS